MMLHQIEFLIEGYLLPPTIGRLQVSEKLILERVWRRGSEYLLSHEPADYAIAYVGVATPKEAHFFLIARDYLDFFLLIYSLASGQPVNTTMGIGTTLNDLSSLGAERISFPNFEKIHVLGEHAEKFLSKPILDAKQRFLQLLPDRQRIMESSLGLALRYYYYAVLASRRRLEEAVIHLMIAAEALLCTDTKKISMKLSRRLSTLIAENETEKAEIFKKMRDFYRLRSGIVHGGGKRSSRSDLKILFNYVRRGIECGLSLRHLSKEELVAKLDKAHEAGLKSKTEICLDLGLRKRAIRPRRDHGITSNLSRKR